MVRREDSPPVTRLREVIAQDRAENCRRVAVSRKDRKLYATVDDVACLSCCYSYLHHARHYTFSSRAGPGVLSARPAHESVDVKATALLEEVSELCNVLDAERVVRLERVDLALATASVAPAVSAARDDLNLGRKLTRGHAGVESNPVGADAGACAVDTRRPRQARDVCVVLSLVLKRAARSNLLTEDCGELERAVLVEATAVIEVSDFGGLAVDNTGANFAAVVPKRAPPPDIVSKVRVRVVPADYIHSHCVVVLS